MSSLARRLLVLGGGGFIPSSLGALQFWIDAVALNTLFQDAALTTPSIADGDPIGAWVDKSVNVKTVTQSTAGQRPILKLNILNGKPIIRFNKASTQFLANTSFVDFADNYTMFIVLTMKIGGTTQQYAWDVSNGSILTGFWLAHDGGIAAWRAHAASANPAVNNGDLRDGVARIHSAHNTGTLLQYWLNGVSVGTIAYTAPNPNTLNRIDIGRLVANSTYCLDGDIGEILIYNRTLTNGEHNQVGRYLSAKWGISYADV